MEEGGCRQGEVEGKWREKAADREKWKTSGGRRLPTGRSLRQVEEGGCRQGEVEGKWREKAADRDKWREKAADREK